MLKMILQSTHERESKRVLFQVGSDITLLHRAAKAVYFKQGRPAKKHLTTDVTHTPTHTNTHLHPLNCRRSCLVSIKLKLCMNDCGNQARINSITVSLPYNPHMLAPYSTVHAQTHTLPSVMWLYELIIWLAKNSLSIISLLRDFLTMWEKLHFRRSDSFRILVSPLSEENTSPLNCCISWVNRSRKREWSYWDLFLRCQVSQRK